MKFICSKSNITSGLQTVLKALGSKTTMPVLEGIYIETTSTSIKLVCTDNELVIQTFVPAVIQEEGKCVIPGKLFYEIIRKTFDTDITLTLDANNQMEINAGKSITKISCLDVIQFPKTPEFESDIEIRVNNKKLISMIKGSIFATAQDASKPVLMGVYCEFLDKHFSLVALDGYRLALVHDKKEYNVCDGGAIIPKKSLDEIAKIIDTDQEESNLTIGKNYIKIEIEKTMLITRLFDGEYIKYKQILPENHSIRIKAKKEDVLNSIERASLMAREGKNNLLKLSINDSKLIITSNSEIGDVYEEIDVWQEGEPIKIAFNAQYLMDVLKNIDETDIYMDFNSNISPCIVRPCEGNDFIYLILPVRTYEE